MSLRRNNDEVSVRNGGTPLGNRSMTHTHVFVFGEPQLLFFFFLQAIRLVALYSMKPRSPFANPLPVYTPAKLLEPNSWKKK